MNAPFQNEIGGSIDVVGVTNSRGVVGDRRIASGVRVLFLVDELEGITAGGSERQVLQLIDIMRKAGHEVWLAVFRNSNWLQQASGGFPHLLLWRELGSESEGILLSPAVCKVD